MTTRDLDHAGLGGSPARGYFTVQMSANAVGGPHCIHLGKYKDDGGLGDNICRNSRHGWDAHGNRYGFSCSGGSTDPLAFPCGGCLAVLRWNPGLVGGMFAHLFERTPEPEPSLLDQINAANNR